MDFFAHQERARRHTGRLVVLFGLAVLGIVASVYAAAVVAALMAGVVEIDPRGAGPLEVWWNPALLAGVAVCVLAVVGLGSAHKLAQLSAGGRAVAEMLGGRLVERGARDPLERRLLNVVEEMAVASGVPVPAVYVLDREEGINAFAAGFAPGDAVIGMTRGSLEKLSRDELQGVIAHEFSHVLNGDMRLNQQLIGLSFGILVLSLMGRWLLRSARYARRGRNSGGIAAALLIGVALTLIGAIGVFCSRLIKAAVSRQREALADASAVQFTREPQGLAGALKKIAGYGARITSVETEEVAHMLFERGSRAFSGWFATHPPLVERIRALDPTFDPRDLPKPGDPLPGAAVRAAPETSFPTAALAATPAHSGDPLDRAGQMDAPVLGGALRGSLPEEVDAAARSRDSSMLLVLALAFSSSDANRERQLALVESQLGAARASHCRRLFGDLCRVDVRLRLPVLELALPALKRRPTEQIRYLLDLLGRIASLDTEQRLFDFVLLRVLEAYLRAQPATARELPASGAQQKLKPRDAVRTLLINVAAFGHEDGGRARSAYLAGLEAVGWKDDGQSFDPPAASRDLDRLDASLRALAPLRPRDKLKILRGVLAIIRADREVSVDETELFRAIAATLDCPLPPGFSI